MGFISIIHIIRLLSRKLLIYMDSAKSIVKAAKNAMNEVDVLLYCFTINLLKS